MNGRQQREREIFEQVAQIASEAERAAYLDQACGGDLKLRARLEVLLEGHFKGRGFLERVSARAAEMAHTLRVNAPGEEEVGTVIGRYKLLEKLGEGGFGAVYVAEQHEPVKRRVALKIIKLGMDTRQVIARFEAERQALALMDHPNIAKVLDGGATETGRPFFVMELVRGMRITGYCDQNNLPTEQRLDLFMQVCHAIQHAHQKGIIHRDIKPTNILVTVVDGRPVPKVIDFGIAKATQGQLTDKTVYTQLHQFIGTPAYMSPEQAVLSGVDVDTRSDIYSLGVLLYELLTGQPPFDPKTLLAAGLDEMRRIIRETEPPKPSTRLATALAANPHSALRTPQLKEVRGDLDWIVMKCLEKDRARRYETANGLAWEVERHLRHEPVLASPPSIIYRAKKFAGRNKAGLAVGICLLTAVTVACCLGVITHTQGLRENEAHLKLRQTELERRELELKAAQAEEDRRKQEQAFLAAEQRASELALAQEAARFNALVEEAQRISSGVYPDFARAEHLFSKAIERRPSEAQLYTGRGSARYELGKYEAANADLVRSLDLQPTQNLAAHWLIARTARQMGEEDRARTHEQLANQQDPNSKNSLVAQALALAYEERGVELMKRAIERDPFDPALYLYRGGIAYNLTVRRTAKRHYDLAVSDLEKALRGRPNDARILETLCLCLVQFCTYFADSPRDAYDRAKQLLDGWLARESQNTSALAILADWHTRNSPLKTVVETCEKGQRLDSACPEFGLFEGWGYRLHGRPKKAIECFSRAMELQPVPYRQIYPMGRVDLHASRGQAFVLVGDIDAARRDLDVSSRWSGKKNWTFYDWNELIGCYSMLKDFEQVIRWCSEWGKVAPECPRAYYLRGRARFALKQYEAAVKDFSRAIELSEGRSPMARVCRAAALEKSERYAEAAEDFDKGLNAIAKEDEQCDTLARFLVATPDAGRWRAERGIQLADAAVKLKPDSASYWATLGMAQYRAGNWQTAVESLEKANGLGGGTGAGCCGFLLAMAHWEGGQHAEDQSVKLQHEQQARQCYDRAVRWLDENEPGNTELQAFRAEADKLMGRSGSPHQEAK